MTKSKTANLIMIGLICLIVAAGVAAAGYLKGWFDRDDGSAAVLTDIRGVLTMTREGVAYPVAEDTVLRAGDQIVCGSGASAAINVSGGRLALGEKAALKVTNPLAEDFSAQVLTGEIFAEVTQGVTLSFDERQITLAGAAALLSVRSGAQSLSLFSGTAGGAAGGQMLSWIGGETSVTPLAINSLNDFAILCLRRAENTAALCFSQKELDELEARRLAAIQEQLNQSQSGPTESDPQPETSSQASSSAPESEEASTPVPPESSSDPGPSSQIPSSSSGSSAVSSSSEASTPPESASSSPPPASADKPEKSCSITILCDTILNNMESLDPAKLGYLPPDGVILPAVTAQFSEGETVFDLLNRVCSVYGIQLEYSWTPMYDSYYIEGINHLYEFDCGPESGWMYKVNGWFPNYGCSSYTLKDGDVIVWCYTCIGLGADVGGPAW